MTQPSIGQTVLVCAPRSRMPWRALLLAYETDAEGYWAQVQPIERGPGWAKHGLRVRAGHLLPVERGEG